MQYVILNLKNKIGVNFLYDSKMLVPNQFLTIDNAVNLELKSIENTKNLISDFIDGLDSSKY